MINREPVGEHLDSQEEDDSKERFDAFFACDCENCDGWGVGIGHGCDGSEKDCYKKCPIQVQYQCECDCHQKPEINIEGASWDNSL